MSAYPFIFVLFPIIHFIARIEVEDCKEGESGFIGVWIGMWIIMVLKTTANMVFSCNMLLVSSVAPSRAVLATINGLAQSCASFVRAIGPITASSLFALSVLHSTILDGNTVFLLFAAIALGAFVVCLNIRDGLEEWRNT